MDISIFIKGVNTQVTIEDKSSRNCPSELNQSCLNNVTISWDDKKFEGLEFEIDNAFDSHGNEGDDTTFIAEEEQDGIKYVFAVEVSVEYNYSNSGNIQAVSWKYLEIDEIDEEQGEYDKGWYGENSLGGSSSGASMTPGAGMGYMNNKIFKKRNPRR